MSEPTNAVLIAAAGEGRGPEATMQVIESTPYEDLNRLADMARDGEPFAKYEADELRRIARRNRDQESRAVAAEAALAAERAKVARLIERWPDTDNRGPIVALFEGSSWWLEDTVTAAWPNCSDGPYPTREAAIMAAIATEPTT